MAEPLKICYSNAQNYGFMAHTCLLAENYAVTVMQASCGLFNAWNKCFSLFSWKSKQQYKQIHAKQFLKKQVCAQPRCKKRCGIQILKSEIYNLGEFVPSFTRTMHQITSINYHLPSQPFIALDFTIFLHHAIQTGPHLFFYSLMLRMELTLADMPTR